MMSFVRVVLDYDGGSSVEGQPTDQQQHIHVGDQFQLLKKTSSTLWLVRRDSAHLPFYLPVSCLEEIVGQKKITSHGLSRSDSSLDRLKATFDPPPSVEYTSASSSDEERGESFDNPVYALPNVKAFSGLDSSPVTLSEDERPKRFSRVEYVNMKLSLDCAPPIPAANNVPIRTLEDSWEEFEDNLGRRYFFHPRTSMSSWKPPRRQVNLPGESELDQVESDCMTDPTFKVTVTASEEGSQWRLHEDSMPSKDYRQANTQMTTSLVVESEAKVTAQLYSDLPPSPSPTHPSSVSIRHVNFMPRYNRGSSLMEENGRGGDEASGAGLLLRDVESEKENAAEEEERRKTASLPMPRRAPPSKDFLELRQRIANKVSLPERTIKARSVLLLSEAHMSELDHLLASKNGGGGMRNSKTLPTMALGKTWKSDEDGLLRGVLNVTKYLEKGRRLKKKQWMPAYVVLKEASLNIYRPPLDVDQAPEICIDLQPGVTSIWAAREKSHRKNVFEITTADGSSQILIQDDSKAVCQEWLNGISYCISGLATRLPELAEDSHSPLVKVLPSSLEATSSSSLSRPMSPRFTRLLGRSRSTKISPEQHANLPDADTQSLQIIKTHKKKKSVDEMETVDLKVKKLKIIERLKNFFSRRPTLESLKAKGIIRDGPVFGCNFFKLCDQEKNNVPTIVRKCIAAIEKKDMRTDGIYRVSGNLSQVQKLRFQIDQDKYSGMEAEEDVNVLTGLLKLFFRELREPMIPFQLYDALMKANKIHDKSAKEKRFKDLVGQLPGPNFDTFRFLFQHLYRVSDLDDHNRMHLPNLAIVFGPTLMWPEVPSTNLAMDMLCQNQVVEYLLLHFRGLFDSYNTL